MFEERSIDEIVEELNRTTDRKKREELKEEISLIIFDNECIDSSYDNWSRWKIGAYYFFASNAISLIEL